MRAEYENEKVSQDGKTESPVIENKGEKYRLPGVFPGMAEHRISYASEKELAEIAGTASHLRTLM